ncbi:MAG: PQQ-binding-like beta-propeller repeat protein [Phycisphaerae bacterium]|nr:PQQ-binding-like beta-propeller repeat protein [Phycisphaerae bacterium]
MRRVLRNGALVFSVVCLAGWGVSGCGSGNKAKPALADKLDDSSLMIAPDLLDHAGLKTTWDQKLPLKEGEKFISVTLLGDRLYLRSDRNYLWSLDRVTGNVIFSRSIAPTGIPVLGLTTYENTLISVIGNKLVELDINTGKEQRVSDLDLSIVAPPVRNNQFFYIGAADRRLHVLRADDLVQTFPVTADDDSLITTVLADDSFVAFGTHAGDLVGMASDAPTKLWQFKATEAVAGPVIRDGGSFYFASTDTQVYRIDVAENTGATMTWKYQTEAVLDRSPRVTKDFVYQYAPGRGLTALAKQSGQAAWSLPEGVDLLAEAGTKAYVITKTHTLAVMDNATGKKLFSVNFAPVTDHAANTTDARIYLMDGAGRVTCLEPIK